MCDFRGTNQFRVLRVGVQPEIGVKRLSVFAAQSVRLHCCEVTGSRALQQYWSGLSIAGYKLWGARAGRGHLGFLFLSGLHQRWRLESLFPWREDKGGKRCARTIVFSTSAILLLRGLYGCISHPGWKVSQLPLKVIFVKSVFRSCIMDYIYWSLFDCLIHGQFYSYIRRHFIKSLESKFIKKHRRIFKNLDNFPANGMLMC